MTSQRALPIFAATLAGVVVGAALMWFAIGERAPQTIIVETRGAPDFAPREAPAPLAVDAPIHARVTGPVLPARTSMVLQNVAIGQTVVPAQPAASEDFPATDEPTVSYSTSPQSPSSALVQTVALSESRAINAAPPLVGPKATPSDAGEEGGTIDDALSFALEASDPHVKEGFTVREDYWGGDLRVGETKAIAHQLFRGNEYWFWLGTVSKAAKGTVAAYDADGRLVQSEAWQKPHKSAVRVVPKETGVYYLTVSVSPGPSAAVSRDARYTWALAYGFR